jgi:hypothetical protein
MFLCCPCTLCTDRCELLHCSLAGHSDLGLVLLHSRNRGSRWLLQSFKHYQGHVPSCRSFMTGRADVGTISARSVTVPLKPNPIRVAHLCHTMTKAIDRRLRSYCASPCSIPGQCMWNLWWTKWHWYRVFSAYVGFALPIPFQQCSMIIFIYMLLLPEGQTDEAWKPTVPFRKSGSTGQKKVRSHAEKSVGGFFLSPEPEVT